MKVRAFSSGGAETLGLGDMNRALRRGILGDDACDERGSRALGMISAMVQAALVEHLAEEEDEHGDEDQVQRNVTCSTDGLILVVYALSGDGQRAALSQAHDANRTQAVLVVHPNAEFVQYANSAWVADSVQEFNQILAHATVDVTGAAMIVIGAAGADPYADPRRPRPLVPEHWTRMFDAPLTDVDDLRVSLNKALPQESDR